MTPPDTGSMVVKSVQVIANSKVDGQVVGSEVVKAELNGITSLTFKVSIKGGSLMVYWNGH